MPHLLCRLIPLLLFVLSLAAPALAAPATVTLAATVFDATTDKPLADAALTLRPQDGTAAPARTVKMTGADGRVEVALPPGDYWLQISRVDYADHSVTLRLAIGSERSEQQFVLAPEAVLTGRLVNGAGAPLAGITVMADGRQTTTDAGGRFRLGRQGAGYRGITLNDPRLRLARPQEVALQAGNTRDLGEMVAVPGVVVSVTLVDRNDRPLRQLAGLQLHAYGSFHSGRGTVNAEGVATFPPLPAGTFHFSTDDERIKPLHDAKLVLTDAGPTTHRLRVELRGAELKFVDSYHDTVVAGKPLKLKLKGIAVKQARLTLQRVDLEKLLQRGADPADGKEIPAQLLRPVQQLSVAFTGKDGRYRATRTVTLPKLAPGYYQLVATGNGATARTRFLVTGLALVTKTSPTANLLFSADLRNGKALAKVAIRGYTIGSPAGKQPAVTASTGRDGLARVDAMAAPTILLARWQDHLALLRLGGKEGNPAQQYQTYLHTERPAYRPGQTVYFKGIARQRLGDGFALPAMAKLTVTLQDPNEQTVFRQEYTPDRLGSVAGEIPLASAPTLGDYTLTATAGSETWNTRFKVLAYRKPEFEVKAAAGEPYVVGGEAASITVRARYYFGAPVANGQIRYRLYTRPTYYDSGDIDTYYAPDGGYADLISEGEATTDENGEATIPITTTATTTPLEYLVELEVADQAGRQVTASAPFTVVPSRVAVRLEQERWFVAPGEQLPFTVTTATYEGTPVATGLEVQISELRHETSGPMAKLLRGETLNLTSDASGIARFDYAFPHTGTWRVTVTAKDSAGRPGSANREFWVWREGASWARSFRELELTPDKQSYRPGETARLVVRSPGSGGSLLLTQEGREVYKRSVHPLTAGVSVIELPITEEQAPYIFVGASTIRDGRFYSATQMLRVEHERQRLKVAVTPEQPVYAPGDTVRLALATTAADGSPRAADLSLGVVDEAIYAIAPEQAMEIHTFFHGQREHLVQTLHSFPRVYLAGAAKGEAAAPQDSLAGLKVRKVFKDTAYWLPSIATDTAGKATAEFSLPDNLTSWRATAIGQTAASEFGSGRASFLARLDVMARLQPPRYLVAGDRVVVPSIITNLTDTDRPVSGRFEISGLTAGGELAFNDTVPANDTLRRDLTLQAATPGEANLGLKVRAGDRGDAMELTLPVLPNAIRRQESGTILLKQGAGTATLTLPPQALAGSATLDLALAPNPGASLSDSVAELVEFPYGCVEQTMSRFLPAVYVRQMAASRQFTLDPALTAKLPKVLTEGLQRLYDFQHEDGGWGWWKDDSTDIRMTATVVYGLALVRDAGVEVRPEVLKRGVAALEALLGQAEATEHPFAYRALTRAGGRNQQIEASLDTAWQKLSPAGQVQYLEALVNAGDATKARPLLAKVKERLGREGSAAFVRDDTDNEPWFYRWAGSTVESSAMLLDTVQRLDRQDPLADGLAEYLLRRRTGRWWQTTQATALAVKALTDYTGAASASYSATLLLNDRELARYTVVNGQLTVGPARLTLPATELRTGAATLRLVKEGTAGTPLLTALLSYQVPTSQPVTTPGLTVERRLSRLMSSRQPDGSWQLNQMALQPGDPVTAGEELVMELVVTSDRFREYVIVEDPLAAGSEVRETVDDERFRDYDGFSSWYTHRERRDDRMAFFAKALDAGEHRFTYTFTPELAGTVQALPAAIWPMYEPAVRSESRALTLEVRP